MANNNRRLQISKSAIFVFPVFLSVVLYQLDSFDPAPYPETEMIWKEPMSIPIRNRRMLSYSDKIGAGQLLGPEDMVYDPKTGSIYTGCEDGWIKRVSLNGSFVENWVSTGGRPLGLARGLHGELIVADAFKGLLNISKDGSIEVLTDEAEGKKFNLTDSVDISKDGTIFFTDASYKYRLHEYIYDFLEGKPYGRFLSYNPSTKETKVLVQDLYFANGVSVSADQTFVIFCETPLRRCLKYFIEGEREGTVDVFIDNLPGLPDNIHYDGQGQYWIAFGLEVTYPIHLLQKYPFIRKLVALMEKYSLRPKIDKDGGVIGVDLSGKPAAIYQDHDISLMSSGIRIGDHLYCGFVMSPYLLRLNLDQLPGKETASA